LSGEESDALAFSAGGEGLGGWCLGAFAPSPSNRDVIHAAPAMRPPVGFSFNRKAEVTLRAPTFLRAYARRALQSS
jgi:hypothetical protein